MSQENNSSNQGQRPTHVNDDKGLQPAKNPPKMPPVKPPKSEKSS